ncbi:hypothetical protein CASFOL_005374 [Castilleja foliolosa]|uniref:Uncharacterized protein n=1 Tax=Castilleja foliolosa TaxID=1961234 RepID=A0ABD3E7C4_9LAMI
MPTKKEIPRDYKCIEKEDFERRVDLSSLAKEIETIGVDVQSTDPRDPLEVAEELGITIFDSILWKLYERPCIKFVAGKIERDTTLALILEALLESVIQYRPSFDEYCKIHYEIVKRAWEDVQLTSLLLEKESLFLTIDRFYGESHVQLLEKLTPIIKGHPPMKDILPNIEEESEASSVRRALTILIGYLSGKDSILPFDDLMGRGGIFGIRTFRHFDSPNDTMLEPISSCGAFMEPYSYTLDASIPDQSLVAELFHDSSFKDVAQQIENDPRGARFANFVLRYFSKDFDEGNIPCCLHRNIFKFWGSACLIHLRMALEESPESSLSKLFKELSDGAEMLRLKERLIRIREDSLLRTIDIRRSDFSLKMRLALSILIGYWSTADMTKTVMLLHKCNIKKPVEDLKDVEVVSYWADRSHDLKGLKNVLVREYEENSSEFEVRVAEIERQQIFIALKAVDSGYDNSLAIFTAIMKDSHCIWIMIRWYFSTPGRLDEIVG